VHGNLEKASISDILIEVHRTINEMTRRKRNVIVTGLPEPLECSEEQHGLTDEEAFKRLCEEHLSLKPALDRKGCIRVGRTENRRDRPRRLLVHLTSDSETNRFACCSKAIL